MAIHFLLLEARPERLIIETTGLGHPARLLDSLRMSYHGRLDVRATLGISETLVRLSVGIEEPDDLIADLAAALG